MTDYYQEGYDKGYEDGRAGRERSVHDHPLFDALTFDVFNPEELEEYEEGYEDGYKAGCEDREREEG